jgi:AcrR family transcriptional regulator
VPQVKKPDKREAILEAAFGLFSRKGFTATTMAEIARIANTTVANLYVYFPSKIVILDEVYRPWLVQQLTALQVSVEKFRSPHSRLQRIFVGVWGDIPAADHCFADALMEALAAAPRRSGKPSDLLVWCENFLTQLIVDSLPEERRGLFADRLMTHAIWMAFDGFAINRRVGDVRDIGRIADLFAHLLLGTSVAVKPDEMRGRPRARTRP